MKPLEKGMSGNSRSRLETHVGVEKRTAPKENDGVGRRATRWPENPWKRS